MSFTFTLTIGHWIIPVAITIAIWAACTWKYYRSIGYGDFAMIGNAAVGLFYAFVGVTCTLATWLVYVTALLTMKS